MRRILAPAREGADVRVIRIGIGDNQSGLRFTRGDDEGHLLAPRQEQP